MRTCPQIHHVCVFSVCAHAKGMWALGAQLGKLPTGLKKVNLSRTSLSPKGASRPSVRHIRHPPAPAPLMRVRVGVRREPSGSGAVCQPRHGRHPHTPPPGGKLTPRGRAAGGTARLRFRLATRSRHVCNVIVLLFAESPPLPESGQQLRSFGFVLY